MLNKLSLNMAVKLNGKEVGTTFVEFKSVT